MIRRLSEQESLERVDQACRAWFGFGVDEFERRWRAGEYAFSTDDGVIEVSMLLGLK